MSDALSVTIWWLTIFVVGLTTLPLCFTLFSRFIDKGYIFTKVLGIFISSYIIWLAANLHIFPFNRLTILIVLIGLGLVNLVIWAKRSSKNGSIAIPWGLVILEECLFFLTLAFWSYVRATEPSIRGLEKFMDFGFVNSILRANFFPPLDMWLTHSPEYLGGYFINYYYFGHYVSAFLTKFSGIDPAVTYNLAMATLGAFTFVLPFSLGMNLIYLFLNSLDTRGTRDTRGTFEFKYLIIGLLAGFLVSFGGNLHTLYVFTSGYPNETPVPPWQLSAGFHPDRYWYPNATRFIPNTIHEFPIYSFVVADLHGHVSNIPFVLFAIAILLTQVVGKKDEKELDETNSKKSSANPDVSLFMEFENYTTVPLLIILLMGVLLSVMYMTNAWDGVIYMILTGLVFLYINIRSNHTSVKIALYKTFSASLFLVFFFLLAGLPFSLNFKPFVSGIGVLCTPAFLAGKTIGPFLFEADHCQRSPIYMLVILWGFFYFNVLGYLFLVILPKLRIFLSSYRDNRRSTRMTTRVNAEDKGLAILRFPIRAIRESSPIDVFVMIMIFISTLLLIFPEFFYMKDIYPAHYRANTMFKLGYQAFMMLGIVSTYIYFRIRLAWQNRRKPLSTTLYTFFFLILFFLVAIYPYFAIKSYYGGLKNYIGLDGLKWLANEFSDDYQAILWIRKNIRCSDISGTDCTNQPVIVEANGDSYTDYARVSAYTGLPTIVGWPVHEWLWRGSYDEAGKRIPEVAAIYESEDQSYTNDILKKYKVEYIFLGSLEREKYPNLSEEKLNGLGKVVFESGETKIYKVNLL